MGPTDLPFTAEKGRFRRKRWRYPQSPPSPLGWWWTRWWEEGRHRPLDLSARWWTWEVCSITLMVVLSLPRLTITQQSCVGLALRQNAVGIYAGHVVLAQILIMPWEVLLHLLDFCM